MTKQYNGLTRTSKNGKLNHHRGTVSTIWIYIRYAEKRVLYKSKSGSIRSRIWFGFNASLFRRPVKLICDVVIKNIRLQQSERVLVMNELSGLTKTKRNVKMIYRHPLRAARLKRVCIRECEVHLAPVKFGALGLTVRVEYMFGFSYNANIALQVKTFRVFRELRE